MSSTPSNRFRCDSDYATGFRLVDSTVARIRLAMIVGVLRYSSRRTHYKPPVLHALCTDELVRQCLNVARLSAQHHDFEAVVMVEMGVDRGDDYFMMLVLDVCQLLRQQARVMV